jgi:ribose transport system substrate-binding protein
MKIRSNAIVTLGFLGALGACGQEEESAKKEVVRIEIPDNAFKPVELEATIQGLVEEIQTAPAAPTEIGVVLKTLVGFWTPVMIGANRAISELGVPGAVVAPSEGDPDEATARQLEILSEQRRNGYNGIGVAPIKAEVSSEIDAFVEAGAPVVTIDSDLAASKRGLYIGTLNEKAGETAGETLLRLMPATSGTVVLLGHDTAEDWPDGYQRTMSAKEVIERAGYATIVHRTTWADGGIEIDVDAMKNDFTTANPPVVGMVGLFSAAYRCGMAAEQSNKTGDDVTIVGFDFEPETVAYMRSGLIKATHAQRQYYMGYLVPYVLYSANALGIERTKALLGSQMADEFRFNAGLDVVAADELDEYNAFLDSLGVGG